MVERLLHILCEIKYLHKPRFLNGPLLSRNKLIVDFCIAVILYNRNNVQTRVINFMSSLTVIK